jgi:hypothetical protein
MSTPRIEGIITTRSPISISDTTETVLIGNNVTMSIPRSKALPIFHNDEVVLIKVISGESIRGQLSHLLTMLIAKQQGGLTAAQLRCLRGSNIDSKKDKSQKDKRKANKKQGQTVSDDTQTDASADPQHSNEQHSESQNIAIKPDLLKAIAAHPLFGNFGTVIGGKVMEEGPIIVHHAIPHTPDLSYWHPHASDAFAERSIETLTPYLSPQSNGKTLHLSDLVTVSRARRSILQQAYFQHLNDAEYEALNKEVEEKREKNQNKEAGGAADVMRRYWEVIPAHLPFTHVITYKPWVTNVQTRINGLLLALDAWSHHPVIGGLNGVGQGQISFDYDYVDENGTRKPLFRNTAPTKDGQALIEQARAWFTGLSTNDLFPMLTEKR